MYQPDTVSIAASAASSTNFKIPRSEYRGSNTMNILARVAAWDTADLELQISFDGGTTWNIFGSNADGTQTQRVIGFDAGGFYKFSNVPVGDFYYRFRSVTNGNTTDENQSAIRVLDVVFDRN